MLIYVTNRKLCKDAFLDRIEQLAKGNPEGIMLREKDLSLKEYELLAIQIKEICTRNKVPLIVNQNLSIARKLRLSHIHLSLADLRKSQNKVQDFVHVGASIHSISEAQEAEKLGASYVIAGHIFPTDCKKGIPGRGISFLQEVCTSIKIPTLAIGGITRDKVKNIKMAGAKGICVMSEAMTCEDPMELKRNFQAEIAHKVKL